MRQNVNWLIVMFSLVGFHGEVEGGEPRVQVGDRVRIKAPDLVGDLSPAALQQEKTSLFVSESFLVGRVEEMDGQTMKIRTEDANSTTSIAMQDVTRLEVWSQGTRKTSGAILGLLGGAILGGVIGNSSQGGGESETGGSNLNCSSYFCEGSYKKDLDLEPSSMVKGVFFGAIIGAAAGGVIGSTMVRDQWDSVDIGGIRAQVIAGNEAGFGLMCSVAF